MCEMLKILRDKPIIKTTWHTATFFHEGERITWYFLRAGKRKFLWESGYREEMWYQSFEELCEAIRDYEKVMRSSL